MSSVYLAVQESLGRNVALKLMNKSDSPTQSERFLNEGRIIASLDHRNIITIHDIGVVGEQPYISMEYLEGGDLEQRIMKGMSANEALNLVEAIGRCLDFVHHKGIVHRDLKPANILFHKDGTPILSDFGIAKQLEVDVKLTMDGTTLGTPAYLSPEQAKCEPLDRRTDIYGLGIILYEMLMGQKPYERDSYIEIIKAHLSDPIPSFPLELRCYQGLLERMIAKDRDERFTTAGEMIEYIHELRKTGQVTGTVMKASRVMQELCKLEALTKTKFATIVAAQRQNRKRAMRVAAESVFSSAQVAIEGVKSLLTQNNRIRWATAGAAVVLLVTVDMLMYNTIQLAFNDSEPTTNETGSANTKQPVASDEISSESIRLVDPEVTSINDFENSGETVVHLGPPRPNSAEQTARLVAENLLKAEKALREYRLTTPTQHNAYYYYQEVLKLVPEHETALMGLAEIADAYANLIERELERFHYGKAKLYLRRGLNVQPNNARLLALASETNAFTDAPKRIVDRVKSLFQ